MRLGIDTKVLRSDTSPKLPPFPLRHRHRCLPYLGGQSYCHHTKHLEGEMNGGMKAYSVEYVPLSYSLDFYK